MKRFLTIFICLIFSAIYSENVIEFDETPPGVILELKRIRIPGHSFAFNPSITRWKNSFVLAFREVYEPYTFSDCDSGGNSAIGILFLNDDFKPIHLPQLLNLQGKSSIPSRAEDPRLITIGERLFLVYSDNQEAFLSKGGYRMHVAELALDERNRFYVKAMDRLEHFEGENPERREKNWVPFEYENRLLLAYSLSPHFVMNPILGYGFCETIAKTPMPFTWKWGELRGGTPAVPINEDSYLAFFHSSKKERTVYSNGESTLHYFMGAYLFSKHPPFEITKISPSPIIDKRFYVNNIYMPYWKPVNVIFPGGVICDTEYVWVVFGRHDHEMWVVKFDRQALLDSLMSARN